MVGWHHQLNGHEFEQAPGAGDGQGGLALLQSVVVQGVEHHFSSHNYAKDAVDSNQLF